MKGLYVLIFSLFTALQVSSQTVEWVKNITSDKEQNYTRGLTANGENLYLFGGKFIKVFTKKGEKKDVFKTALGEYTTTEAQLLKKFPTTTETISQEDGLALVRYCCDRLENEVYHLANSSTKEALMDLNQTNQ